MLEDAGAEERRRHPDGSERRNFLKNKRRLRSDHDGRGIGLLVFAGGDERHRALVIRRTSVGMQPLVELWRSREREREEKGRKQSACDKGLEFFAAAHGESYVVIEPNGAQEFSGAMIADFPESAFYLEEEIANVLFSAEVPERAGGVVPSHPTIATTARPRQTS